MPLDGATIFCIKNELQSIVGCHIDKIHIPTKNEFVFSIRGKGFSKKLYISIVPDSPRISFTGVTFENPQNPPMFCMLLRKHLSSGKIVEVNTSGTERLIIIKIKATNELGDSVTYSLIVEMLGHKTNLILLDPNNKILDAARRSNIEKGDRLIQPGALYTLPEASEKTDLILGDIMKGVNKVFETPEQKLSLAIINSFGGISPLISREIAFLLTKDSDALVNQTEKQFLYDIISNIKELILSGGKPHILLNQASNPVDFSYMPIRQYGSLYNLKEHESFSALLESFYTAKEHKRRIDSSKAEVLKLVKTLINRNTKKLTLRKEELLKAEDRELLRIYGELIKANIYCIEKGQGLAYVQNYYDSDGGFVEIPLDTALSPAANAAKYFKDYKKACVRAQTLTELINLAEKEGYYLDSVLFALQSSDTLVELNQIKKELSDLGYLKQKQSFKKAEIATKPLSFEKNGFIILVGRNNLQNDELTLKIATKNDLWFHTKNIHGSHVVILTENKTPDDDTLIFAANLAAKYSKACGSNQVPVDYTPIKYVKKPAGAKPGMVIYTTNKTIFANPSEV